MIQSHFGEKGLQFVSPEAVYPVLRTNGDANKLSYEDRSVHDWYRFVLSFPPHLVRTYLTRFGITGADCVLDPFCGTGTTIVECKKLGVPSFGIEAHPMTAFASRVKTDWSINAAGLGRHSRKIAEIAENKIANGSGFQLSADAEKILLRDSISPIPLGKALALLAALNEACDPKYRDHEFLALANTLVFTASNLNFGPEVGIGKIKKDAAVLQSWLENIRIMRHDILNLGDRAGAPSIILQGDSRETVDELACGSIDAVITSPPYPNEKDYTRTTRLESVLLGFIDSRKELQDLKRKLVRSNTRNIYKGDTDDAHIDKFPQISTLADRIEARRIELNKTSGFERLYATVTRQYFGGMVRHLANLRQALAPGARLAYVVGDQASFFRIMIRTGELLSQIAVSLGYELIGIDLFRTRLSTATRSQLREEVVLLRWPG
ncbi:MAG: DNA methyltransferase [Syntrophobacteraceae bacterium]|nr:DNA methyltransferase [Syntrophobacteraceae bacterium]